MKRATTALARQEKNAGFTLVELIIVLAIMSFLIALSAPMVEAARSDISMNRTLRYVKTDLITGMGYALAGKSIGALSSGDLMDTKQIPESYALYFQTSPDDFAGPEYKYLELVPDGDDFGRVRVNYQIEKEWPSPAVALREIRLLNDDGSVAATPKESLIFFTSPFGRINIISNPGALLSDNGTLDLDEAFNAESHVKKIELEFQFRDNEIGRSTLSLSTDKTINIQ
jgi:prepilin-type N-terminal cleavage/methylation domain-containing protein